MARIQVKTKSSGVSAVNSSPKILMGLVPTVEDLTDGLADYVHSAVYNEFLSPIKDEIKRLANGLTDRMQSTFHLSDDLTWIYTRISEAIYWTTINGVYSRKDDKGKVKYISDNSDLMYVIKNAVDWSGVRYEDVFGKELAWNLQKQTMLLLWQSLSCPPLMVGWNHLSLVANRENSGRSL